MASTEKLLRIVLKLEDQMSKELDKASDSLSKMGSSMSSLGSKMTLGLTAPIVGLGALAVKTAIDFESAFAGVIKTVDGTEAQLSQLRKELENLATSAKSPVSALEDAHLQLFKIAEVAGQLGVARKDIVEFTDVMGQLAMSTNIAGEEGAQMIARFANVANMPLSEVRNFGDAIVELGNNFATTEQDILNMATRLANISQLGFKPDAILAIGTALSSLGISAELGGTNFAKGMYEISTAVAKGGQDLANFAEVAGMSSEQFANLWNTDVEAAMMAFINGLGEMTASERILALEKLGFKGQEMQRVFLALAGNTELLTDAMNQAGVAFEGSGALMDEASKRAETTAGRINRAKNIFNQVLSEFGTQLIPIITDLLQNAIIPLLQWINGLDEGTRAWVMGILAVVASLGPVLTIIGQLISAFTMIKGAMLSFAGLGAVFAGLKVAVIGFGATALAALAPFIPLILAIVAASALLWAVATNFMGVRDAIVGAVGGLLDALGKVAQGWGILLDKAKTSLSQLGTIVWEALKGLGKAAWELGVAIIEGLLKGMASMAIDLIGFIFGLSQDLTNAVKEALGIASPSKVMMDLGENVVKGFHEGIEGMGGIGVTVPKSNAMPMVSGDSASFAGATGGGGNVYIQTINVPAGTSKEQVDYIMKEVGKASSRRGAKKTRR